MIDTAQIKEKMSEIYNWLETQIRAGGNLAGVCTACGKCCHFDRFGHHLFVTTVEISYLAETIGRKNIKPMTGDSCPYNTDSKCTIYENRFAGCRIFCCSGDKEFQSQLSEAALRKIKTVHTELKIPYNYTDLATTLNSFAI